MIQIDVPIDHMPPRIELGFHLLLEPLGFEMPHTFHNNVLAASRVLFFYLYQLGQASGGCGHVFEVKRNAKAVRSFKATVQGFFELLDELSVTWFENVQAGALSGQ